MILQKEIPNDYYLFLLTSHKLDYRVATVNLLDSWLKIEENSAMLSR